MNWIGDGTKHSIRKEEKLNEGSNTNCHGVKKLTHSSIGNAFCYLVNASFLAMKYTRT